MNKQLILLASFILLSTQISFAQTKPQATGTKPAGSGQGAMMDPNALPKIGVVKGNIIDSENGEVIEYATIALTHKRLKKIMAGGITNENGIFQIGEIPVGMYELKVEFIGYEPFIIDEVRITPDLSEHTFKNIKLKSKMTDLGEVNVTAERAVIVNKIDRKVVSVDKDLVSAGGSAIDVLENVPSVDVDTDGNISLRGSQNVTILIDGRPSGLSSESTGALLEAIPSESIESIEIITNPSAKYDPEGVSGILNIILKKNKLSGFNGQISAGIGTNDSYNIGVSLNFRSSKLNLSSNYNFRQFGHPMSGYSNKTIFVADTIKHFNDVNTSDRIGGNHSLSFNADYFINTSNVWSFGARASTRNMDMNQLSIYENYYEPYVVTDYYQNSIIGSNVGLSIDLNTNYRKTFSAKTHFLEGEIAYSNYNSEMNQSRELTAIDNQYYPDGFVPNNLNENTLSNSSVYTLRLDYAQPIGTSKFELGTKATLRSMGDNYIAGQLNASNVIIPDPALTNNFIYNEDVYAVYSQFGGVVGNFSYQTGLRGEFADINSELVTTNELYPRNYFSIYPSVFLLQKLNKNNEINLNYSRRVNRPDSRQLNPFGVSSDPYNIRQGNPYLNPEYINALEAGFTHYINKSMLNATLYYRFVSDVIENVNILNDFGVSTITYQNIGSRESYGGELTFSGQFYKWWSMNSGINFYQLSYSSGESIELSNAGFTWNVKASNNFRINPNLSAQLSATYDAPRVMPQGSISSRYGVDFGIKQDFLKKKASLNLRVRDIFNTRGFAYEAYGSNYELVTERNPVTRMFQLSLSYRFGKMTMDKNRDRKPNQENGEDNGDFEM
jgi:outer membrane receptor protein involved in Fe transport